MSQRIEPFRNWNTEICSWKEIATEAVSRRAPAQIELTVVRHGQTTNNELKLITGASNPPLTAAGLRQTNLMKSSLSARYDVAFRSNLLRSRETLDALIKEIPVGVVLEDARLAERSMGVLEGEPTRPLSAYDRGDLFWAPPGGETYGAVAQRVASFLLDLVAAGIDSGHTLRVLASSHVGTMRILAAILERSSDPVAILTRQIGNAVPLRFSFHSIEWPPFLDRAEVGQ